MTLSSLQLSIPFQFSALRCCLESAILQDFPIVMTRVNVGVVCEILGLDN